MKRQSAHMRSLAIVLLLAAALTGCATPEEQAAQEALDEQHRLEQMWEAGGHTGPLPDISESGVSASVSSLARTSERIIVKGTDPTDCETLREYWDLIYLAEFVNEQQALLEGLKDSLSQAISGCEDNRWNDAIVDVADVLVLANAYVSKY